MKIIGISINGVIRDVISQFDKMYRKRFIKDESLVKMDEYFRFVPDSEEEVESENLKIQQLISDRIKYPIDTYDLKNHYKFKNEEEFNAFLHQDYVLEIFGSAQAIPRAMDKINHLQKIGLNTGKYEIVLISDEEEAEIQATYHFLAKTSCRVKKVIFEKNINRLWDFCDIIITDNPLIIEAKPENKVSVKIEQTYNNYDKSNYSFKSIVDIDDKFLNDL